MIYLILTIVCSTVIVLLLKYNREKKGSTTCLLAGNYLFASLISLVILFRTPASCHSFQSMLFGAFVACIFVFSFYIFSKAVSDAGPSLAALSSRLSLVIPVAFSIILFKELPGTWQIFGFVFAVITIMLFSLSVRNHTSKHIAASGIITLIILLVAMGTADLFMKVFSESRPVCEKPFFLAVLFSTAFFITLLIRLFSKKKIHRSSFIRGFLLGVPNFFSSYFLLEALKHMNAIIVYPAISISIIILTAATSYFIWKEKLNAYGLLALVSGGITIILLNIQ